jgi:hypothetical protein
MWQTLLRKKYLRQRTLTQVEYMLGFCHFWSRLMKFKSDFLGLGKFKIGDGTRVRLF